MSNASGSSIDRALRAATRTQRVPGVVAAVTDRSGTVYTGAFGCARLSTHQPMRADTVFRIASMTKLVTTVAVLQLHDQGRVDLDAPFKAYYPEFRQPPVLTSFDPASRHFSTRPSARDITVRQLLTHTSGFGYWFLNSELRALMGAEPEYYNPPFLMSEPGSRFQYGISTDVLGQLITPVSGLPLAEFFAQRIFAPLGMRETAFAVPQDAARLATLHAAGAGGFNELPNELAGEPPRGGGGLYATVGDFVELLRLFLNTGEVGGARLLAAETVQAITRNQIAALTAERQTSVVPERTGDFLFMDGSQKFGLGVLLETRDRAGGRAAGSCSWGGIFNTYFWVDPDAQLAAALFMQMSPFSAPACMEVYREFEQAVYGELRPRP